MKILYSHRIQSHDGQGVHVEEMVAVMRRIGHEVLVVGPGFYRPSGFGGESRLVPLLRRLLPGFLAELDELAYNIPAYGRLRRACDGFGPDLIYERYNLYYLAGATLARRRQVPFYVEVNAPLVAERTRFGTLHLQLLARWSERHVWTTARRVLVVTGVLKDIIAQAGVSPERISVTPNGIDPSRFPATPPNAGEPVLLGFVGFMRAWHGLDGVINAIAAAPDQQRFRLMMIGDGPARLDMEQQTRDLGLADSIQFAGLATPDMVPAMIATFDIALQPKAVVYASPLKIFEYMAAGRAIVAPDQPNIREILEHGRTALLFDPAEPGAIWAAIRRLADDPALRAVLGEAAREEITRRDYTWDGNARRVVDWATADARHTAARAVNPLPGEATIAPR